MGLGLLRIALLLIFVVLSHFFFLSDLFCLCESKLLFKCFFFFLFVSLYVKLFKIIIARTIFLQILGGQCQRLSIITLRLDLSPLILLNLFGHESLWQFNFVFIFIEIGVYQNVLVIQVVVEIVEAHHSSLEGLELLAVFYSLVLYGRKAVGLELVL